MCALTLIFCIAEYALRKIDIKGLSGHKIHLGEGGNSRYYPLLAQVVAAECKDFQFTAGHCYPYDTTGRLPLKVVNPYDGNYWYCVAYDKQRRRQGYNPERKRQIALIGDSFVFGEGVKEADTLGYLLNDKYTGINFQNWGKIAANIHDVAGSCKKIMKAVPVVEEVIYIYNLNDFRISNMMSKKQAPVIFNLQNIRWMNDEKSSGMMYKLLSKSAILSSIHKIWVIKRESYLTIQTYKDMYLSEKNRPEFLSTMDEIRSMKEMLAERGISFRMIIYPLLYKDMLGRYPFGSIHTVITHECNKREILCLDGYQALKNYYSLKRFAVNPLDYHPNGLCNRELVNYIYAKNFIKK